MILKMKSFFKSTHSSFLFGKNEKVLFFKNKEFFIKTYSSNLKEYCKKYEIPIFKNLELLEQFEKINNGYLNTEEGAYKYEILKNYIKGVQKINNFKND